MNVYDPDDGYFDVDYLIDEVMSDNVRGELCGKGPLTSEVIEKLDMETILTLGALREDGLIDDEALENIDLKSLLTLVYKHQFA